MNPSALNLMKSNWTYMVVTVTGCLVPGPHVSLSIHPKQLITVTTARFLVFEGEMPDKKALFFV